MLTAATGGAEMVKRLQTFAAVRADIKEQERVIVDVATTVRNAAELSKPLWAAETERMGVRINLQMDLQDGCPVRGQENEIFEVIINLLRNAAEAMPQGGPIEVKACREGDDVVITLRDRGTGIAGENIPRVFQPFWSTKGFGIGEGMGLATASRAGQETRRDHIRSKPGRGGNLLHRKAPPRPRSRSGRR